MAVTNSLSQTDPQFAGRPATEAAAACRGDNDGGHFQRPTAITLNWRQSTATVQHPHPVDSDRSSCQTMFQADDRNKKKRPEGVNFKNWRPLWRDYADAQKVKKQFGLVCLHVTCLVVVFLIHPSNSESNYNYIDSSVFSVISVKTKIQLGSEGTLECAFKWRISQPPDVSSEF